MVALTVVRASGYARASRDQQTRQKEELQEKDNRLQNYVAEGRMNQAKASGGAVPKAASHSSAVSRATNSTFLARSLALQAAELSSAGRFQNAATLLTRTIELEPHEARYFTNHAICHLALNMHHEADQDASAAMSLEPTTTKPHFLRGRAKLGLKSYSAAAACFEQVLRMKPSSEEGRAEFRGARRLEICNAGATLEQAETMEEEKVEKEVEKEEKKMAETLLKNSGGDTQGALDALSRSRNADARPQTVSDTCSSAGPRYLVVRNITHEVTRDMLTRIFFRKPVAADNARTGMHGEMLCGKRLHVELVNTPSAYEEDTTSRMAAMTGQGNRAGTAAAPAGATAPRGPVGRRECRYWRGTGCRKGDKCGFIHIRDHKGMDR
ncbi:hypothetical protein HPB48_019798 [Haemaphysalis longicornis]|uniref:C3H1-type domain-containing protein n=1 Tax=Haemaphysalis longicornis TaxID=44386 RepID=A0A9J6GDV1_HAELO|nr:hypothetical protein HPB48_019798 [Haemaphysalis longicornis]